MNLADVILKANNSQLCFAKTDIYTVPAKGVTIHKIDFVTAWREATILQPCLQAVQFPLTLGCACWMIEALGDPKCMNKNIGFNVDGTPRSNEGKDDPNDYDCGCCQEKLGYLHPYPMPDLATALQFAMDPALSIPRFASTMAGNLMLAQKIIATLPSPEPRYKDPFMVATAIYNEGHEGFLKKYYTPGIWLHHCVDVQDWERWYAQHLGLAPMYPLEAPLCSGTPGAKASLHVSTK